MLRLLARLLIRGPDARFIRTDLEEHLARDVASGMTRRRARLRYLHNLLGSATSTWRARFDGPGLPGVSLLDFRLGLRMLVRYPGLTVVGGLALAFAIWTGAGTFEALNQIVHPELPLPDGDRIVGIRNWDAEANSAEGQILHDFETWRAELETVRDVGAFRPVERNLITANGASEPQVLVEISASAFRVTRVNPLLGRPLLAEDERPGAPAVVVIGHELWQRRFDGDPQVIGRTVRLGHESGTIVGVMPDGFGFPIAHELWVPFRENALDHERREGPGIRVFGRLTDGASLEDAQAELDLIGRSAAADFPETHANLRPQVMPYAESILSLTTYLRLLLYSFNLPLVFLLLLICSNIALLMFARAATRENEIVVRNALGASRGRIIVQLFVEALVLGALAAVLGLSFAGLGLRWFTVGIVPELLNGNRLPFWFSPRLSPPTIAYALLLTLLCAVVAGVVPALKATAGIGVRLRQATAGGGGFRFGGFWTVVVIAQIAITVILPAITLAVRTEGAGIATIDAGFPTRDYLSVRLEMDRDEIAATLGDTSRGAFIAHARATTLELERRLSAGAAVSGVTFAERLPLTYHPYRLIELDEGGGAPLHPEWPGYRVSQASVDLGYFDVFDAPILAGRDFHPGDLAPNSRAVIVNEFFVRLVLGGRNAIGRRLRYTHFEEWDEPREPHGQPWYEIVGVVPNLGMAYGDGRGDPKVAGVYHPVAAGSLMPVRMAVHVPGRAGSFAPELRRLAAATDPTLRLYDLMTMDRLTQAELEFYAFWIRMLIAVTLVALTLSLAGIYSVMAFTVSQRTREIGIRVALGASRRSIVRATLGRPTMQVAMGVFIGMLLMGTVLLGESMHLSVLPQLIGHSSLMLGVCLLAAIVPTRRALSIKPGDALRMDA